VGEDLVGVRWEREQALLGLAWDTPDDGFAVGGLAVLAVPPTVRIVVLPGDPCAVAIPPQDPVAVIPQPITAPAGQMHGSPRGTASHLPQYSTARAQVVPGIPCGDALQV
jgi:hypothetical protein